jgi:hypothetical protein
MYEITKNDGATRWLRVVRTRVYRTGQLAEFQTVLKKSLEHVYLITAEAISAVDELNPHLRYMNTQGDQILLQGTARTETSAYWSSGCSRRTTGHARGRVRPRRRLAREQSARPAVDRLDQDRVSAPAKWC